MTCDCVNKEEDESCHDKFGNEIPILEPDETYDIGW